MAIQDEIKRLKELGHTKKKVAQMLGINRETVRKYWDGQVDEVLQNIPEWVKDLDWEYINQEINQKVPKKILYEELTETRSLPSYQSFCQYIRNHPVADPNSNVVIPIERHRSDPLRLITLEIVLKY